MENKLKPCPFCGGEPEHYQYRISEYSIRCKRCKSDCGGWKEPYRAEYVWNTRPAENALKAEVERLKVALTDIATIGFEGKIGYKVARETMRRIANAATPEKGGEDELS